MSLFHTAQLNPYPSGSLPWGWNNIFRLPNVSEAALNNMGKCITLTYKNGCYNHNKIKQNTRWPDMMTTSKGNIFRVTQWTFVRGIHRSPVYTPHSQRPVTRSFDEDFFDLRVNKRWIKHRDAGDFRRHRAHYDVTAMLVSLLCSSKLPSVYYNALH